MQQFLRPAHSPSLQASARPPRAIVALYLATLALLPWTWFPPFPWLHEHAQWSDAVFAITTLLWAVDLLRKRRWPRLSAAHIALVLYFLAATLSFALSSSHATSNALKLLGIGELCMLALITFDLAVHADILRSMSCVTAVNAILIATASVFGLVLFYAGVMTPLVGIYGELAPSPLYARIQAGLYNPNLLASFCIFAATVVSLRGAELPAGLRRASLIGLWLAVLLTFSRGVLGFVLAAIIRNARTPWRRTLAAMSAVIALGIMISLTAGKLTLDPTQPFKASYDISTPTSRYQAIATSFETLIENPLSGSGPGTHPGRYLGNPFDSHMTFLNIAATLGLPALLAFISLFIATWRRRSRPTDLILWGGLAGLALDGLAQDIEDFRHLWVLIGIAFAHTMKRETEEQERAYKITSIARNNV